jgi:thiamine-monophosphate kinase
LRDRVVAGGDDYEISVAVRVEAVPTAVSAGVSVGVPLTPIGRIVATAGVRILDAAGRPLPVRSAGYRHFA